MSETVTGFIKPTKNGATLRDPKRSFRATANDPVVSQDLMRRFDLVEGAMVTGELRVKGNRRELASVTSICGVTPEQFRRRKPYTQLDAVDPTERFHLAAAGELDMRIVDLVAPIGKGTRGLIVSPPKAGKTIILEHIAQAVRKDAPDARVVLVLIDERPEEVTHFRRNLDAEVYYSTNDQTAQEHVDLAEMILANVRCDLECGRNVVVLVDSLTRMGRAFNVRGTGTGRTMSGGVEAGALEVPRRFFGLARNIENGGSVTIIATALVDTGSRMDDLIFQEFKGTGNSEIMLDRAMSEARIFPAINIVESGTRKEERLRTEEETRGIAVLRRVLSDHNPKDAMNLLLDQMRKYPTNEEMLSDLAVPRATAAASTGRRGRR